jgi:serine/threonine protein kinase
MGGKRVASPQETGGSSPLERFELIEQIGRGGMGVVWKARDKETGQIAASTSHMSQTQTPFR